MLVQSRPDAFKAIIVYLHLLLILFYIIIF